MLSKQEIMDVFSERGYTVEESHNFEDRFFFQKENTNGSFYYEFCLDKTPNSEELTSRIYCSRLVCGQDGQEELLYNVTMEAQEKLHNDGIDNFELFFDVPSITVIATYYLPTNNYDDTKLNVMLDEYLKLEEKLQDFYRQKLDTESEEDMLMEGDRLVDQEEFEELLRCFSEDEHLKENLTTYRKKLLWPYEMTCKKCGKNILRMYVCSPAWTWEELCGREGYLYICPYCKEQDHFECTVMS